MANTSSTFTSITLQSVKVSAYAALHSTTECCAILHIIVCYTTEYRIVLLAVTTPKLSLCRNQSRWQNLKLLGCMILAGENNTQELMYQIIIEKPTLQTKTTTYRRVGRPRHWMALRKHGKCMGTHKRCAAHKRKVQRHPETSTSHPTSRCPEEIPMRQSQTWKAE